MPDRLDRIEAALEQLAASDRRIQDRHEALTMNLELASREIQDLREQQSAGFAETKRIFEIALDSIKRLERIATAHEQRIDGLENQ